MRNILKSIKTSKIYFLPLKFKWQNFVICQNLLKLLKVKNVVLLMFLRIFGNFSEMFGEFFSILCVDLHDRSVCAICLQ